MELGEERDEGIPYWIVVAVVAGVVAVAEEVDKVAAVAEEVVAVAEEVGKVVAVAEEVGKVVAVVAGAAVAAVETAAAKELDTTDSAVDPEMPLPDYPDSSSAPQPCFPFDSSHVPR